MNLRLSKNFRKYFKKRVLTGSSLANHYQKRVALFLENRNNPLLKDHKLTGKLKKYRAFSITGDVRVVYKEESKTTVTFIDIGSHNQVYT